MADFASHAQFSRRGPTIVCPESHIRTTLSHVAMGNSIIVLRNAVEQECPIVYGFLCRVSKMLESQRSRSVHGAFKVECRYYHLVKVYKSRL